MNNMHMYSTYLYIKISQHIFDVEKNISVQFLYTSSSPVNLIEIDTAQKYF